VGVFLRTPLGPKVAFVSPVVADRPAVARLSGHLAVEGCGNQVVPGSILGGRILTCVCVLFRLVPASRGSIAYCECLTLCDVVVVSHPAASA
jgi:hypothetical protein